MTITLEKRLTRLLVSSDPITGEISLQAQWADVIFTDQEITCTTPQSLLNRNYGSVREADNQAVNFPGFTEIVEKFQSQPFSAIADLLEALRQPVMADGAISPDILPQPLQEPS